MINLKLLITILLNALFIYLIILILLYLFADKLIFYPPRASYQDNDQIIKLTTADGAIISAIYLANPQSKFTILYSHGNATDIGDMLPFLHQLQQHGFAVFAYDYHGYGTSTGNPSEKNSYYDSEAAYNYLTQTLQITPQTIIGYGQSVGAAVTLDLATKKLLGGVILESPFITAFRTVTHYPLLPFDKFNNLSKIKKINIPILIIHGTADRTVAIWHGEKLFSMAKSPKFSLWIVGSDHNVLATQAGDNYWQALNDLVTAISKQNENNYDKK